MKRSALQRKAPLRSDPEVKRAFVERGRRASAKTMAKRQPISPASPEQREKVRDRICVNCGDGPGCNPAHLTPRSHGGCDSADCVISLCRTCHDVLDGRAGGGPLDLEPVLALRQFSVERSHMALHLSFEQCRRRLRGAGTAL